MTLSIKRGGVWTAIPYGESVLNEEGIGASYETVRGWSIGDREDFGVFDAPDPDPPPVGKVEISRALGGNDRPVWVVTYADAPPVVKFVPESISDRQFAQALAKQGVFTKDEALAFVKRGEVPASLQAIIDAIPDADARFDVDMQVSGATTFERSNPSTIALTEAMGWSPAETDVLWRYAASLR